MKRGMFKIKSLLTHCNFFCCNEYFNYGYSFMIINPNTFGFQRGKKKTTTNCEDSLFFMGMS